MKPKVISVESINSNYLFDPDLVKYEFRRKINTRLSGLHHQMKQRGYRDSALSEKKTKPQLELDSTGRVELFKKENISIEELLYHVYVAMQLQQNLYEAAMATNRIYSVPLLIIFLESFLSIIFNCYFLIAVVIEPHNFRLPLEEALVYLLQHLILPTIYIVVPVLGYTWMKTAFKNSQRIVNKVVIYVQDAELRTMLMAFSQQIDLSTPQFGVFGFFSLDGSVIFAMISSTTTYLIILVQTLGDSDEHHAEANHTIF